MILGGLKAGKVVNSLRSSTSLGKVGSAVKSGLSGIKQNAALAGLGGFGFGRVSDSVPGMGDDSSTGEQIDRAMSIALVLGVVIAVGQLFDIQIG